MGKRSKVLIWLLLTAVAVWAVSTIVSSRQEGDPFSVRVSSKVEDRGSDGQRVTIVLTNVSGRGQQVITGVQFHNGQGVWESCQSFSGPVIKGLAVQPRSRFLNSADFFAWEAVVPDGATRWRIWVLARPHSAGVNKLVRLLCDKLGVPLIKDSLKEYRFEFSS